MRTCWAQTRSGASSKVVVTMIGTDGGTRGVVADWRDSVRSYAGRSRFGEDQPTSLQDCTRMIRGLDDLAANPELCVKGRTVSFSSYCSVATCSHAMVPKIGSWGGPCRVQRTMRTISIRGEKKKESRLIFKHTRLCIKRFASVCVCVTAKRPNHRAVLAPRQLGSPLNPPFMLFSLSSLLYPPAPNPASRGAKEGPGQIRLSPPVTCAAAASPVSPSCSRICPFGLPTPCLPSRVVIDPGMEYCQDTSIGGVQRKGGGHARVSLSLAQRGLGHPDHHRPARSHAPPPP